MELHKKRIAIPVEDLYTEPRFLVLCPERKGHSSSEKWPFDNWLPERNEAGHWELSILL